MKKILFTGLSTILFICFTSACSSFSPQPSPTPTALPTLTRTSTLTYTPTLTPSITPTPSLTPTVTITHTPTPLPPLGESGNPIIIALVPGSPELNQESVQQLSMLINLQTEEDVRLILVKDYAEVKENLCSGNIHGGILDTQTYLEAQAEGCALVAFISEINGSGYNRSQFLANSQSGINSLNNLQGNSLCRSQTTGWETWLLPSEFLQSRGYDLKTDFTYIDKEDDLGVLEGLTKAECQLGITRDGFLEANPDYSGKINIIGESAPSPNPNISFHPDVPGKIEIAMINVTFLLRRYTDENGKLIKRLYGWDDLIYTDNTFYNPMWEELTPQP